MHYSLTKFMLIFYFCYAFWFISSTDGKGGRGGGGSRSSVRFGGSRSSTYRSSTSIRSFRSSSSSYSRSYYTSRYSYTWKTRVYTHRYVYVGHYHSWNTRRSYDTNDWNLCFNLIFSGANNTPIVAITSHQTLRDLDDSVYETAVDRLLSASMNMMDDNSTDVTEDFLPTEESSFTEPWQYMGLFVCPMFPDEPNAKYCCGPDEFQYCCSYWDSVPIYGIIFGTLIVGVVIYFLVRKGKRIYRYCNKRRRGESMEMVNTVPPTKEDIPAAEGTAQPLLGYNPSPPPPPGFPGSGPFGFQPYGNELNNPQLNAGGMPPQPWPQATQPYGNEFNNPQLNAGGMPPQPWPQAGQPYGAGLNNPQNAGGMPPQTWPQAAQPYGNEHNNPQLNAGGMPPQPWPQVAQPGSGYMAAGPPAPPPPSYDTATKA